MSARGRPQRGLQDPQAPRRISSGLWVCPLSCSEPLQLQDQQVLGGIYCLVHNEPVSAHNEVQRSSQGLCEAQVDASGPPRLHFSERKCGEYFIEPMGGLNQAAYGKQEGGPINKREFSFSKHLESLITSFPLGRE